MKEQEIDKQLLGVHQQIQQLYALSTALGSKKGELRLTAALAAAKRPDINPNLSLVPSDTMVDELLRRSVTGVFSFLEPDDAGTYSWNITIVGDTTLVTAALNQTVVFLNVRDAQYPAIEGESDDQSRD